MRTVRFVAVWTAGIVGGWALVMGTVYVLWVYA